MIRFLLLFIAAFYTLEAADIVEIYRLHGMNGLEKRLDRELASAAYWEKVLQRHDIRYGYFDKETDLLVCDKSKKRLQLYAANGHFYLKQSSNIIIGKKSQFFYPLCLNGCIRNQNYCFKIHFYGK